MGHLSETSPSACQPIYLTTDAGHQKDGGSHGGDHQLCHVPAAKCFWDFESPRPIQKQWTMQDAFSYEKDTWKGHPKGEPDIWASPLLPSKKYHQRFRRTSKEWSRIRRRNVRGPTGDHSVPSINQRIIQLDLHNAGNLQAFSYVNGQVTSPRNVNPRGASRWGASLPLIERQPPKSPLTPMNAVTSTSLKRTRRSSTPMHIAVSPLKRARRSSTQISVDVDDRSIPVTIARLEPAVRRPLPLIDDLLLAPEPTNIQSHNDRSYAVGVTPLQNQFSREKVGSLRNPLSSLLLVGDIQRPKRGFPRAIAPVGHDICLTIDKAKSPAHQIAVVPANRLSSTHVVTEVDPGEACDSSGLPSGFDEELGLLATRDRLSPVNIHLISLEQKLERAHVKRTRMRHVAEVCREKLADNGFSRMKSRHRRRLLRRANSEPLKPSRIRCDTSVSQVLPEPLSGLSELDGDGDHYGWFRCESPDEISVYEPGTEGEAEFEYLEDLAALCDQPAGKLLVGWNTVDYGQHRPEGGVETLPGHNDHDNQGEFGDGQPEYPAVDAFDVHALITALQAPPIISGSHDQ